MAKQQVEPTVILDAKKIVLGREGFSVVNTVFDINLSLMHDGMMKFIKKNGLEPEKLTTGNSVLFVNRKKDYIKLLVGNGTRFPIVAAYRMPVGVRFSMAAVKEIAEAFRSKAKVDATLTLRQAMKNYFRKLEAA